MDYYRDRRKYPRVDTHIPVKYRKLGDTGGMVNTNTVSRDLCEGGVRFRTHEFVARACRMVMELNMPMFTSPVKAIGKVAWIRKLPSGDGYEIGNRFLEINRQDKRLLAEYVDSLMQYND